MRCVSSACTRRRGRGFGGPSTFTSADRDVASDAVAEAFAQALRRGADLRSPERWVWRAAFRIAAGELKQRRIEGGSLTEASYDLPDETAELLVALPRGSPRSSAPRSFCITTPGTRSRRWPTSSGPHPRRLASTCR